MKKYLIITILGLVTANIFSVSSCRKAELILKEKQSNNEIRKDALKNPAKEDLGETKKVIKPATETRTKTTTKKTNGEVIIKEVVKYIKGDTIIEYVDNGSITKPVYPDFEPDVRRWSLIGISDLKGKYGGGISYRFFEKIPVELGAMYIDNPYFLFLLRF
jgi:hypothetical protein